MLELTKNTQHDLQVGTYNLSVSDTGCQDCACDPSGTLDGHTQAGQSCNQNNGQCACLTNRIGKTCSNCIAGWHEWMVCEIPSSLSIHCVFS